MANKLPGHGVSARRPAKARWFARRISLAWLAVRVSVWLCCLPFRLRRNGVRVLLRDVGQAHDAAWTRYDARDAVRITSRVCRFPVFRLPLFPKACLRESLALYHVLSRMGQPARFHIGVRRHGERLCAHSWITCQGEALVRADGESLFSTMYSYPDVVSR